MSQDLDGDTEISDKASWGGEGGGQAPRQPHVADTEIPRSGDTPSGPLGGGGGGRGFYRIKKER